MALVHKLQVKLGNSRDTLHNFELSIVSRDFSPHLCYNPQKKAQNYD